MKKFSYVLKVNECIEMFGGINEVYDWFKERGVKKLLFEDVDDDGMDIVEGVNFLREEDFLRNGSVKCFNEELVERGDDYVDIGLWEGFVNC